MSLGCGCPDDENAHVDGGFRDSIVFGACNTCAPRLQDDLERPYEQVLDTDERGGH